jgi:hypothetical protein
LPIITQRESTTDVSELRTNTGAPRAVKERILSRLGIQEDKVAAPTLSLQTDPAEVRNMVVERAAATTVPAQSSLAEMTPEVSTEAMPNEEIAPKEEALSPRLAALARREREITRRAQQFAAEKKAWEEERAKLTAESKPRDIDTGKFISLEDLEKDTIGTLSKYGYNPDKLTEKMLDPGNSPMERELQALKAEIAELKGIPSKIQEELANRQKMEYDAAVNQIRRDVSSTVANSPDYSTIKEAGHTEAVVKLIEKTFEDTGEMLSIEDAAAQVEEYLIEEAIKVANYSKVRARTSQTPLTETQPQTIGAQKSLTTEKLQQRPNSQIQLKTLTNATGAVTTKARTEAERRARAIAIARGEKL